MLTFVLIYGIMYIRKKGDIVMTLIEKLKEIEEKTLEEFENENYDCEAFEKIAYNYCSAEIIPLELLESTPLADFERKISEEMDNLGCEYSLELIDVVVTCDGGCFEPYYHLSWYDGSLHTMIFHFATSY